MLADTSANEEKAEIAIDTFGTIAYLVEKHGDDFALMQDTDGGIDFSYFKSGPAHFEDLMARCRRNIGKDGKKKIAGMLDYIADKIKRKMIIILITDMVGMHDVNEEILRHITVNNDLLVLNIDDAYLYGEDVYDVTRKKYEDDYVAHREKLYKAEKAERDKRYKKLEKLYTRYGVSLVSLQKESEIIDKVVELFERHKHENIG